MTALVPILAPMASAAGKQRRFASAPCRRGAHDMMICTQEAT